MTQRVEVFKSKTSGAVWKPLCVAPPASAARRDVLADASVVTAESLQYQLRKRSGIPTAVVSLYLAARAVARFAN